MIINIIINTIATSFYAYGMLIAVRCLLTWLPWVNWNHPVIKLIKDGADIYLNLFKFIPPLGPFDLSPMVAIFVLYYLGIFVIKLTLFIFAITGALG